MLSWYNTIDLIISHAASPHIIIIVQCHSNTEIGPMGALPWAHG